MANQAMDKKAVISAPRNKLAVRFLVALGILALVIVSAQTLARQPAIPNITPNDKAFEQTFSTQQYWDKAADYEARKATMEVAPESSAVFSTQQYWDKAAAYEAAKTLSSSAIESPATFSTQQYWDKAAEYEAGKAATAAAIESPAAFSTQQYWDKAAEYESNKAAISEPATLEEPEWSYYTERYWSKTR